MYYLRQGKICRLLGIRISRLVDVIGAVNVAEINVNWCEGVFICNDMETLTA